MSTKRKMPTVYKATFSGYYVLTDEVYTQPQLESAYKEQQEKQSNQLVDKGGELHG